jgi:hypothetical protein
VCYLPIFFITTFHLNRVCTKLQMTSETAVFLPSSSVVDHKLAELLMSPSDQSNELCKLVKSWKREDFKISRLAAIFKIFVDENTKDQHLFSLIMPDWRGVSSDAEQHYIEKFLGFGEASKSTWGLFYRLFSIIDNPEKRMYRRTCLKIIYFVCGSIYKRDSKCDSITDINIYKDMIIRAAHIRDEYYRVKILQILIVGLENTNDSEYEYTKQLILEQTQYTRTYASVLALSYDEKVRMCDALFFELAFVAKQKLICEFKTKFFQFIRLHREFFGDYHERQILLPVQLLYQIVKNQQLNATCEFITQTLPQIQITSSFLLTIRVLDEFYATFSGQLSEDDKKLLERMTNFVKNDLICLSDDNEAMVNSSGFQALFKNTPQIRKLLFGRMCELSPSLFETILISNTSYDSVLDYLWTEFQLFDLPEIFAMVIFF